MALSDVVQRFQFHKMSDENRKMAEKIRTDFINLADTIDIYCEDNREKSLCLTHLEEALMWCNKSLSKEG